MKQYLDLSRRIVDEGVWVENSRTGTRCLTVINADFVYDCRYGDLPIVTTRKSPFKMAIAEMLGYLKGYSSAADFRALGTKSWDANANLNAAWLANPHRLGEDDCGRIYGVQARGFRGADGTVVDQVRNVLDDLCRGIDNRREIITFYNPAELHLGCLAPCMHTHTFSILDGGLYLTSISRSVDVPLGLVANMQQAAMLLMLFAQIANLKPMFCYHKLINCHIYENQYDLMVNVQLQREPLPQPKLVINPAIKSLDDIDTWVTAADFTMEGYQSHPAIDYPFSV